jgi:sugar phosphate isomerase/epimerase
MRNNFNRRHFIKTGAFTAAGLAVFPSLLNAEKRVFSGNPIRFGGPVEGNFPDPINWVKALKTLGYSAAYCPVQNNADSELIKSFESESKKNNIIIAEVGAWSNPLNSDEKIRKEALKKNIEALQLADEIGACCCVNITGARGEIWDGPYAENYTKETFELIIETTRYIIDQVKPLRTFYTLEDMPYMLPDSPDSYLDLIKAVNRKQFAVHLDPVNMISSPQRYFRNADFIKECFTKLGPYIKSIHAKDIILLPKLTVHLEECMPGAGLLDYGVLLQETSRLKNIPLMLEHLETQQDYKLAADYVRMTGEKKGITFFK